MIYSHWSEGALVLLHLSMLKFYFVILGSMQLPFASISSCPDEVDVNIRICFSTKFRARVYMDLIHQH